MSEQNRIKETSFVNKNEFSYEKINNKLDKLMQLLMDNPDSKKSGSEGDLGLNCKNTMYSKDANMELQQVIAEQNQQLKDCQKSMILNSCIQQKQEFTSRQFFCAQIKRQNGLIDQLVSENRKLREKSKRIVLDNICLTELMQGISKKADNEVLFEDIIRSDNKSDQNQQIKFQDQETILPDRTDNLKSKLRILEMLLLRVMRQSSRHCCKETVDLIDLENKLEQQLVQIAEQQELIIQLQNKQEIHTIFKDKQVLIENNNQKFTKDSQEISKFNIEGGYQSNNKRNQSTQRKNKNYPNKEQNEFKKQLSFKSSLRSSCYKILGDQIGTNKKEENYSKRNHKEENTFENNIFQSDSKPYEFQLRKDQQERTVQVQQEYPLQIKDDNYVVNVENQIREQYFDVSKSRNESISRNQTKFRQEVNLNIETSFQVQNQIQRNYHPLSLSKKKSNKLQTIRSTQRRPVKIYLRLNPIGPTP